jgi:hypothetical protein
MLKRSIALILILATVTANFSRLYLYAAYELNKSYIASTLCENRDKPQLHCNGRCFLAKKIKQAEDKEKKSERDSQKNMIQEAFLNSTEITLHIPVRAIETLHGSEIPFALPVHNAVIFQPPRV